MRETTASTGSKSGKDERLLIGKGMKNKKVRRAAVHTERKRDDIDKADLESLCKDGPDSWWHQLMINATLRDTSVRNNQNPEGRAGNAATEGESESTQRKRRKTVNAAEPHACAMSVSASSATPSSHAVQGHTAPCIPLGLGGNTPRVGVSVNEPNSMTELLGQDPPLPSWAPDPGC